VRSVRLYARLGLAVRGGKLASRHGSQSLDEVGHVGRGRALESKLFLRHRMREAEHGGVQGLSGKGFCRGGGALERGAFAFGLEPAVLAVGLIAKNRRADMGEVDANLVRASGFQSAFDKSSRWLRSRHIQTPEGFRDAIIGNRQLPGERRSEE